MYVLLQFCHYFIDFLTLFSFAGIIGAVAKDFFNSDITMEIVNQLEELERTGKKEHVVFLVTQWPDVAARSSMVRCKTGRFSRTQSLQPLVNRRNAMIWTGEVRLMNCATNSQCKTTCRLCRLSTTVDKMNNKKNRNDFTDYNEIPSLSSLCPQPLHQKRSSISFSMHRSHWETIRGLVRFGKGRVQTPINIHTILGAA